MSIKKLREERGAALVEFALVFPILFLVLITLLSMLWLLAAKSALTGAARDGARFASIRLAHEPCDFICPDPVYPDEAAVAERVRERAGDFAAGDLTVELEPDDDPDKTDDEGVHPVPNGPISVTVSRDLPIIFAPVASIFGWDDLSYTSEAQVRAE